MLVWITMPPVNEERKRIFKPQDSSLLVKFQIGFFFFLTFLFNSFIRISAFLQQNIVVIPLMSSVNISSVQHTFGGLPHGVT